MCSDGRKKKKRCKIIFCVCPARCDILCRVLVLAQAKYHILILRAMLLTASGLWCQRPSLISQGYLFTTKTLCDSGSKRASSQLFGNRCSEKHRRSRHTSMTQFLKACNMIILPGPSRFALKPLQVKLIEQSSFFPWLQQATARPMYSTSTFLPAPNKTPAIQAHIGSCAIHRLHFL